ncbi:MerR family transcriptional regulator [Lihuaxuella thermophila]|uniref:DNA binding domain-containing protein, excisionase family n=1 Tax=Lihuaxuella thermophila TaxID=1173111 RepID=A0A1H8HKN0_9BACL|nr:MerR family transcriptional regulator [Lihuaxuella thermophila]SEN56595.1 DNA binding domain-containing protein, excisionase family [Lihuaxuella thermophila]
MSKAAYITTREAAERLQVHARTIRKWIDTFEEYICPDWNERGHYVLTEESLLRLAEIKNRLQEPHKSMKQVKDDLLREGKIGTDRHYPHAENETKAETEQTLNHLMETMENFGEMMEDLFDRMERLEDHMYGLFDTLEDMEQKLVAVSYDAVSSNEVQQMFDEIRKKQDQLRIELRNVNFTQRLTSATSEQGLLPRRQKKTRFFGMF